MAQPYIQKIGTGDIVYLENAAIVPYPIDHEVFETVTRTEDGRLKVYKHGLAGSRKRTWRIKVVIDNSATWNKKWSDLETFYWDKAEGAKNKCNYTDVHGTTFVVRIIGFAPRVIAAKNIYEVQMILEEDYA